MRFPNEFETDDQFCPGCSLELKTLPTEQASLWVDLFMSSLNSDDEKYLPGLFVFYEWGLKRRLNAEWRDYITSMEKEIDALKKSLDPQYPFVHGLSDKPKPVNIAVNLRGNPHALGEEVPRRFLQVLSPETMTPFTDGSGRLQLANDIVESPIATRVFVNRVWKWHFGSGIVGTPDNFGFAGERPSDPELAGILGVPFQGEWIVTEETAARDHAVGRLPDERGRTHGSARKGWQQPALLALQPAAPGRRSRFATRSCSSPAILI